MTEIELPFLAPLVRLVDRLNAARRRAIEDTFGYTAESEANTVNLFRIPFVDYARGDGYSIGPGGDIEWDAPGQLEPPPDWALHYRGLWGFYARDVLSGEDAPAGPMYNRDGSVRQAWYNPLGWAGLDKVPPPNRALQQIDEQRENIRAGQSELETTVADLTERLTRLGVGAEAMRGHAHLRPQYEKRLETVGEVSASLNEAQATLARDAARLDALDLHAAALRRGERRSRRAHITRAHLPFSEESVRMGVLAEFWSAVSIGLMMIAVVALAVFEPDALWVGLAVMVGLIVIFEALFPRDAGAVGRGRDDHPCADRGGGAGDSVLHPGADRAGTAGGLLHAVRESARTVGAVGRVASCELLVSSLGPISSALFLNALKHKGCPSE